MLTWTIIACLLQIVTSDWEIKLTDSDVTSYVTAGQPFHLVYGNNNDSNKDAWKQNNFSWFFPQPQCNSTEKFNHAAEVVCTEPGVFAFAIEKPSSRRNQISLLDYREILVRPSYHCFYWTIEIVTKHSHRRELRIGIARYREEPSSSPENWNRKFLNIGESPKVVLRRLGRTLETLSIAFDTAGNYWKTTHDIRLGSQEFSLFADISSQRDVYAFDGCFIKPRCVHVKRQKYDRFLMPTKSFRPNSAHVLPQAGMHKSSVQHF